MKTWIERLAALFSTISMRSGQNVIHNCNPLISLITTEWSIVEPLFDPNLRVLVVGF